MSPPELRLTVEVRPRAGRDEIVGWQGTALRVRVAAPPAAGAANLAVCALLAARLGCARSRVVIVRGQTARTKVVRVLGVVGRRGRRPAGDARGRAPGQRRRALRLVGAPPLAFYPVSWQGDRLVLLDQRRLPGEEVYVECRTLARGGGRDPDPGGPRARRRSASRRRSGSPWRALASPARDGDALMRDLETAIDGLAATRPTAVNLFWALERMRR